MYNIDIHVFHFQDTLILKGGGGVINYDHKKKFSLLG